MAVEAAAAARGADGGEASSRPGTADADIDLEPDASPPPRGHRRRRPREPAAWRPGAALPALKDLDGARETVPDAISQLEQLDGTLLTRRDVERLFGVPEAPVDDRSRERGRGLDGGQVEPPFWEMRSRSAGRR